MSVVKDVITNTLGQRTAQQYATQVDQVATALQSALDTACENLVGFATQRGLSEREARQALRDVGLLGGEEAAPQDENTGGGKGARIAALEDTVAKLVRLAEDRLGARI